MDKLSEADCLNAIEGRVIKSIKWEDPSETHLILDTQDGLRFIIQAGGWQDSYLQVYQVEATVNA